MSQSDLVLSNLAILTARKPMTSAISKGHQRQHHRHFNQYANHRGEGRTWIQTKQRYGNGNGQLKEIAGADHARWSRYRVAQLHF